MVEQKLQKELNARGILNPMGYRNKVLNQNFKLKDLMMRNLRTYGIRLLF